MVMLIKRILAQLIDIIVYLIISGFSLIAVNRFKVSDIASVIIGLIVIHLLYFLLNYPFYKVGQSIGKGFFRLYIVSIDKQITVTWKLVLLRELFFKVLPLYTLCIPVLWKSAGLHDKTCNTEVISK